MWISQKITGQESGGGHQMGRVTGSAGNAVLLQGDTEYKALRLSSPYGITSLPPEGAVAVVLTAGGDGRQDVCIGTRVETVSIEPGEILLRSAGGATVYLKNNGDVVINGRTI